MNITSTFGKGCDGSLALNACKGSGEFCSKTCPFNLNGDVWKEGMPACYTEGPQKMYKNLIPFLDKHQENFTGFLYGILANMDKLKKAPWVRFSSFGSFPEQDQLNENHRNLLQEIAHQLRDQIEAGKVHFPVETITKYHTYSKLGFRARLSLATNQEQYETASRRACVVGSLKDHMTTRINQAKAKAKDLMKQGVKAIVCPAVGNKKIKCGNCTACGSDKVEMVVYPVHV